MVRCAFLVLMIAILGGCAASPQSTGFLTDYSRLQKGRYLDKVWVNPEVSRKSSLSALALAPIAVDRVKSTSMVTAEQARAWLTQDLRRYPVFSQAPATSPNQVQLSITALDPGNGALRVLAGEFGVGKAFVQIEGRVVDKRHNTTVMTFADRRRSTGSTGIDDVAGSVGDELVAKMLRDFSASFQQELTYRLVQ